MTDNARAVLRKMKRRDARKASKLFRSPKARERVLNQFNRFPLDDVRPIGGGEEQGIKILSEINSMVDEDDEFVRSLMPRMDIL